MTPGTILGITNREMMITADRVTIQCRKTGNLKAPGRDGVQAFWLWLFKRWIALSSGYSFGKTIPLSTG